MKLILIRLERSPDDTFSGSASFSNSSGIVQVDLDQPIVDEMLTVYDKAIAGLADQIAAELVADSVKRKGH